MKILPDGTVFPASELTVLELLARGLNRKQVADEMIVYRKYVNQEIESIQIKLDIEGTNIRQVVRVARERGVIE